MNTNYSTSHPAAMRTVKRAATVAAVALASLLGACANNMGGASAQAGTDDSRCQDMVGQSTNGKAVQVCFPNANRAWLKEGTFVSVEGLRRMNVGMRATQVRELISYPHFDEGFFGPQTWNYVFNFRTGAGQAYMSCQYQVQFEDGFTSNLYWNRPECGAALGPKVS